MIGKVMILAFIHAGLRSILRAMQQLHLSVLACFGFAKRQLTMQIEACALLKTASAGVTDAHQALLFLLLHILRYTRVLDCFLRTNLHI